MRLICNDCGERNRFYQSQYVRVSYPIDGAGEDIGIEDETIDWEGKLNGSVEIECACGSLEVEWILEEA